MNTLRRCPAGAALALSASHVCAHSGGAEYGWNTDPWVILPLSLFALLYLAGVFALRLRRAAPGPAGAAGLACAGAGMLALFLALIWPLDPWGETSFAAHMAQHMLLIAVAAPLLVLARADTPVAAALATVSPYWARVFNWPRRWLRPLAQPGPAFALHGMLIWAWHAPLLFEAALREPALHILEHFSFLGSGLLFWAALLRTGRGSAASGAALLYLLATLVHTGMLGALITFARRPLYPAYLASQGSVAAALEDQALAGLVMWIPGGFCYLAAGLGLAAGWLHAAAREGAGSRPGGS